MDLDRTGGLDEEILLRKSERGSGVERSGRMLGCGRKELRRLKEVRETWTALDQSREHPPGRYYLSAKRCSPVFLWTLAGSDMHIWDLIILPIQNSFSRRRCGGFFVDSVFVHPTWIYSHFKLGFLILPEHYPRPVSRHHKTSRIETFKSSSVRTGEKPFNWRAEETNHSNITWSCSWSTLIVYLWCSG